MSVSKFQSKELKKHVAAIRVSNNVGLLARKSWNVLLLNAYEQLLNNETHQIPLNVFSSVTGYNSKSYDSLKNALEELQTTLVEWDLGGGCEVNGMWVKNFKRSQMLGYVGIVDGVISYRYDAELAKELYNPEIYQRISIAQQKLFKSSHSLALWENCLRYIGVGSTGLSDINEWKELLGATAKTYGQFKFFKSKILLPAIKEVNNSSNIHVELQVEKRGRRITKMGFLIQENKQQSLLNEERIDTIKVSTEYQYLLDYGISKVQALAWIQEYGFQYIHDKLELLKKNELLGGIKSPSGFLVKSIERDFQDPDATKKAAKKRKAEEAKKLQQAREQREQLIKKLEENFIKQHVQEYVEGLSDDERGELLQELQSLPMVGKRINGLLEPMAVGVVAMKIPDLKEKQRAFVAKNINSIMIK